MRKRLGIHESMTTNLRRSNPYTCISKNTLFWRNPGHSHNDTNSSRESTGGYLGVSDSPLKRSQNVLSQRWITSLWHRAGYWAKPQTTCSPCHREGSSHLSSGSDLESIRETPSEKGGALRLLGEQE